VIGVGAAVITKGAAAIKGGAAVISRKSAGSREEAAVVSRRAAVSREEAAVVSRRAAVSREKAALIEDEAAVTRERAAFIDEKAAVTKERAAFIALLPVVLGRRRAHHRCRLRRPHRSRDRGDGALRPERRRRQGPSHQLGRHRGARRDARHVLRPVPRIRRLDEGADALRLHPDPAHGRAVRLHHGVAGASSGSEARPPTGTPCGATSTGTRSARGSPRDPRR
jgi:hypothetical protein